MTSGSVMNQAKSFSKGYLASLVGISTAQARFKIGKELNMQVEVLPKGAIHTAEARASVILFEEDGIVQDAHAGDPTMLTE